MTSPPTTATALIPFVPAGRDFELAIAFFGELGFAVQWRHEGLAGLRFGIVAIERGGERLDRPGADRIGTRFRAPDPGTEPVHVCCIHLDILLAVIPEFIPCRPFVPPARRSSGAVP